MIIHTSLVTSNLPIKNWLLGDDQQIKCTNDQYYVALHKLCNLQQTSVGLATQVLNFSPLP